MIDYFSSCSLTSSMPVWIAKCSLSVYTEYCLFLCVDGCCLPFSSVFDPTLQEPNHTTISCLDGLCFYFRFSSWCLIASAVQTPLLPCYPCIWFMFYSLTQPSFGNGEPLLPRPLPASVVDSRISERDNNDAAGEDSDEEPQKVSSIKFALQFGSLS